MPLKYFIGRNIDGQERERDKIGGWSDVTRVEVDVVKFLWAVAQFITKLPVAVGRNCKVFAPHRWHSNNFWMKI